MNRKIGICVVTVLFLAVLALPVYAQEPGAAEAAAPAVWQLALAMAIAAAGCGYAQSKALTAGCDGVSRNPGSADTIRFFIILGLAFIEFLALLTFVVVLFLL
ncbi:MAG TPA: ATP synthase F0 subunit C [Acidobacteriota bacterium]|nr:ATP synthase F0 subunit C [Acidobacteriota bacterium]